MHAVFVSFYREKRAAGTYCMTTWGLSLFDLCKSLSLIFASIISELEFEMQKIFLLTFKCAQTYMGVKSSNKFFRCSFFLLPDKYPSVVNLVNICIYTEMTSKFSMEIYILHAYMLFCNVTVVCMYMVWWRL